MLTHDGTSVAVHVKDAGHWTTRETPRRAPEDADAVCGRGLDLVAQLTRWWQAFVSPTGTHVVACLSAA